MRIWVCIGAMSVFVMVMGCGDNGGGTAPTNHAPVLGPQSDTTVALGDSLELWAVVEDSDGDVLTYTLTVHLTLAEFKQGYFPDAKFNTQTGYFWFRPSSDDRPSRDFTFGVNDGRGGLDSTRFTVTVN